jgi:hypothetical protein
MTTESISPLLSAMSQRLDTGSVTSNSNSNAGAEFQQVLSALIMSQLSNPLSSGDESSSQAASDPLSSIMSLLMNQFSGGSSDIGTLMNQISSGNSSSAGLLSQLNAPQISLTQAQGLQINQFAADKEMGGDGANSNCGPTSLVMALRGLGLSIKGEGEVTSNGAAVDLARRMMVADNSRDGVDSKGRRAEGEQNSFTDFDDLARGVQAAGGKSEMISESASSIRSALMSGAKVIVSGTFVGKSTLPWTGDRGPDNRKAPGGATMHIVAVTGYNAQTNSFIINDPARLRPIEVSGGQLESFMEGNAGAMAISRS